MKRGIFFVLIILMIESVFAFGISPGRETVNYIPGLKKTVSFKVINNEAKDLDLVMSSKGELSEYILIKHPEFILTPYEIEREVSYDVLLPENLEPGLHTAEVAVLQIPEENEISETFVGATVSVLMQFHVNVPYPGKYAEVDMNIFSEEGKVTFLIPVLSRGEFDLAKVKGVIDIYSSLNEKIAMIETNEINIKSKERGDLVAEWMPDVAPGPYRATATVTYDGETKRVEKNFNVGKGSLSVVSIEVNDFSLGEIAKFEMLVENKKSESIEGVYSEMQIFDDSERMLANFKSPTYDIDPFDKTLIVSYWDTKGVDEGTYDSNLILKYSEGTEEQRLKLEVEDESITIITAGFSIRSKTIEESGGLVKILIGVIIFLVILNISWFVFLRKKMFGKSNFRTSSMKIARTK